MTPQSIITDVRTIIKDADSTAYRNSDEILTAAVNRAMRRVALVRPDLFTTITTLVTVAGVLQTCPNYGRIVEVYGTTGGGATTEANRETLDELSPTWRSDAAGPAVNWMRHSRNPSKFFIYPQSAGGISLDVEYAVAPAQYALTDTIPIFDAYLPAVIDMTVAEVEWADDENVLNQRAETFFKRAKEQLMSDMQMRPMEDKEGGGVPGAID